MKTILVPLLTTLVDLLRSQASLHLEMLALRQQLAMVASRDNKRLRFRPNERVFWVWLYRLWPSCVQTLAIFKPATLVRWHRWVRIEGRQMHDPPSATASTDLAYFLGNHVSELVSVDFSAVPTATH